MSRTKMAAPGINPARQAPPGSSATAPGPAG